MTEFQTLPGYETPDRINDVGGIAADRLRAFVERIENLQRDKDVVAADMKDVYAEAKGTGFNVAIIRMIIRLRKMERDDRREQEELLDLYKQALGMMDAEGL